MSAVRQFWGLSSWLRVLVGFIFLWGLLVFVFVSKLGTATGDARAQQHTLSRLNEAITYLEDSKQKNAELRVLIDDLLK